MASMVTAPPSRFRPPPDPPPPPLRYSPPPKAPSPMVPPKPPDPPDVSSLLALPRSPISSYGYSPQNLTGILDLKPPLPWMASKISGGGAPLVFTGGSTFVYGHLFRAVCRSLSCRHMDWSSIRPGSNTFTGFQDRFCSVISALFSSIEWDMKLFVCVTLELRTIVLANDVLTDLTSVDSTIVLFDGSYVVLVRPFTAVCSPTAMCSPPTAVCSPPTAVCSLTDVCSLTVVCSSVTVFILAFGVLCLYFSFWWQLKEKLDDIFSWMNMIMTGIAYLFVSCLEQSLSQIFSHVLSELDVQVSLVLQGSSSQRVLSSAFGAVCVILWVTLDAISQEASETVLMRFLMVSFYDLYRHPILYLTSSVVCLARSSFVVSYSDGV